MKPEVHEEIYRVAFDAANSELNEISMEVDRLRSRKDHIEKLVAVLKPLVTEEEQTTEHVSVESLPQEQTEPVGGTPVEAGVVSETVPADPFQRRIDHVLGIGAGIRDVRKFTRQF